MIKGRAELRVFRRWRGLGNGEASVADPRQNLNGLGVVLGADKYCISLVHSFGRIEELRFPSMRCPDESSSANGASNGRRPLMMAVTDSVSRLRYLLFPFLKIARLLRWQSFTRPRNQSLTGSSS